MRSSLKTKEVRRSQWVPGGGGGDHRGEEGMDVQVT